VRAQPKLIALDADGLAVISAHLRGARVHTRDIIWRQGEKRLVVGMPLSYPPGVGKPH